MNMVLSHATYIEAVPGVLYSIRVKVRQGTRLLEGDFIVFDIWIDGTLMATGPFVSLEYIDWRDYDFLMAKEFIFTTPGQCKLSVCLDNP